MDISAINILICEDEDDIRQLLKIHIENQGFTVFESRNGLEAIEMINNNKINLLLLDVMMPIKNGFEVIKELRRAHNLIPIIILTARSEDDNKILGLDLGADDYICKPFNYREVISRVKAQLRRYFSFNSTENKIYKNGKLKMDMNNFEVYNDGRLISLNPQEFKLLEIFMANPGRVFTKEQLYEKAWNSDYIKDDNTLMVHISRLRDKLQCGEDKNYIQTIRGLGYRMVKIEK
ncbi:response regulator transcription factor [Clostridium oryzae]|uniref:Stage 0 sporulation protein A homolog n=1 Tax=Clostridium oryzae TaxID=1450648 RepID=A0A1V4I3S0_9CLOT|nr:response regulator transcription factor [Clostridium oryzae]OPJ54623.1 response regulator MprA [Clostridium oryzae]